MHHGFLQNTQIQAYIYIYICMYDFTCVLQCDVKECIMDFCVSSDLRERICMQDTDSTALLVGLETRND